MTNNCDLEEMRHIAQQKFIELVDSGVEWKVVRSLGIRALMERHTFGPWVARIGTRSLSVLLKGEEVWTGYGPYAPETTEIVIGKDGIGKPKQTKERKAYEKALDAFEADPMVVAIRKIEKVHEDRECEKRRQGMKSALESSCKALQEALKDTATTLAPEVQTGNTEPYSKSQDYPLSSVRKFWQIWRGV